MIAGIHPIPALAKRAIETRSIRMKVAKIISLAGASRGTLVDAVRGMIEDDLSGGALFSDGGKTVTETDAALQALAYRSSASTQV